jgi:hypothetical protein
MPSFLHVGCGQATKADTIPFFQRPEWREIRLDIDASVAPDIVGTMTNMAGVPTGSIDAIYSSHNIEHLYAHEVEVALREFWRVLTPTGFAVITCPDLQAVCKLVAEGKLLTPAYVSAAGPIAPLDMLYGFRPSLRGGNHFMAHHCGFTLDVLLGGIQHAGFGSSAGVSQPEALALWAVGRKDRLGNSEMEQFTRSILTPS